MDIIGRYIKNWNALDTAIYFIEILASKIMHRLREETEEPNVEEIILAETQYLQDELTYYKVHQEPGRIVESGKRYFCPECRKAIETELIDIFKIKYCPECGKRIILDDISIYAKQYVNNVVRHVNNNET